ncbi:MAG TPA: DUF1801 domain-containing protein [Methanomassiliicoccales archaeon]|nr:DUF1801 domain-containing protein [Methanomassiliicoccales archaeon]
MNVEEFVEKKVLPQYRPIVAAIRRFVRTDFPALSEEISYGILAFRKKHIVAVISPTKKGITLAFSRGAEFDDRFGLLEGVGKRSKNLRMSSVDEIDLKVLSYYFGQAVGLDLRGD